MKDTWNVYDWGKNLVNDRFRLISNLLLLFIILFLGFQNVYGDFTREGFLYAYPVSILVFAFPIYLNIYWLVPRFLYKAKRKLWCYWISFLGVNLVSVLLGFIFLSPLYQRYGIRGFCIQDNHAVSFDSIAYGVLVLLLSAGGCTSFELFRRWVVSDKKILELEKATKQTELQQLKKQINPHFLYNVLDTINWMARKKGEDNICRMVTSISSLMRASISNKRSMVYIREEIKYVQDYLYIQETRYGDKFTSYIEVDERLNELEIPKMTIQTLVENAVVHGVENATWDCFLYVSGEITDGMAVFTVKDDGVGMSQEQLEKLMGTEEEPDHEAERTHTHLGVYAVRKRLDYVYQNKARMSITSEPGKGTQVILEIPMNGNVGVTYRKCDEPVNENNKKRGDER